MPTVVLDTINDAQIETRGITKRAVRTGYITDVASTGDNDPEVMYSALQLVINAAGGFYPNHTELPLAGVFLKPFRGDAFFIRIFYETLGGLQPSVYIIRDRAWTVPHQTNIVPGLAVPIRVKWTGTDPGGGTQRTPMIPADNVTMTFNLPVRGFQVSGLKHGQSAGTNQQYVGYVNDSTWPTAGRRAAASRDVGCYQLAEYSEDESVYQGYYTYNGSAIARSWGDWREYGILRSSLTGKFADIDQSELQTNFDTPYDYGIIGGSNNGVAVTNGFVAVGPFPKTNFTAIFGF